MSSVGLGESEIVRTLLLGQLWGHEEGDALVALFAQIQPLISRFAPIVDQDRRRGKQIEGRTKTFQLLAT